MTAAYPTIGRIERRDPGLDRLIPPGTVIERLAEGFRWSEGPVWWPAAAKATPSDPPDTRRAQTPVPSGGDALLFTDIPRNVVHRWSERDGLTVFMQPSGYTGAAPRGGEPGANGLTRDLQGRLLLCEHGDRRVTRLEADGRKTMLADRWQGRRLNSPNDVVVRSDGSVYFTDPPYGLEGRLGDPAKELDFQGLYRIAPDGTLHCESRALTYPNGLAFSPDERTLYVANSDPQAALWFRFAVAADGSLGLPQRFFDAGHLRSGDAPGLPDGVRIDRDGNLFATGPGGVLVLTPDGTHLGTIVTGSAIANCAWGDDGSTLYLCSHQWLCRVRTGTVGEL